MDFTQETLSASALFGGIPPAELAELIRPLRASRREFGRDALVAFEGDPCSALGFVAAGSLHIQRMFPSGKIITIETFHRGDSFGEALVFSDEGSYPATLVAQEDTTVIYIARADIVDLCGRSPQFMQNFMCTLSARVLLLNQKIKSLSFGSVRQKVANFLVQEQRRQNSDRLQLRATRSELADSLGIPRPSLSRELAAMKDEGWVDFHRREIRIIDPRAVERVLEA